MVKEVKETVAFIQNQGIEDPEFGVVLGTGLGEHFVRQVDVIKELSYTDIPHFPVSRVEFHKGKLIYGTLEGVRILAMQGRFHYYEGYSLQQVTFPIRVMAKLGIQKLFISNAAGNMNSSWSKGELMVLDDHINLQSDNPLRGEEHFEEFGTRFVDMSAPYDQKMNTRLGELAEQHGINLRKGVYVAVNGPNLETRAEYRFLRQIGADAVGMSTVPEVIVANQMGLRCTAVSVLTDDCDPDNLKPVNIAEILEIAGEAEKKLALLTAKLIGSTD